MRIGLAKRLSIVGNPAAAGFSNGTATSPSIFFTSESTLGLYRHAVGILSLSRDSKLRIYDAAGNVIRIEPGSGFFSDQQSAGSFTIDLKINSEDNPRASFLTQGFKFGPGSTSFDCGIMRNGVGITEINTGSLGAFAELKLRHLLSGGTAPTIASGFGTGPSIAGSDTAGRVTVGTGGLSLSGIINFGTIFTTAPAVMAMNESTTLLLRATATTTQLTLTSATPFGVGDLLTWIAVGY